MRRVLPLSLAAAVFCVISVAGSQARADEPTLLYGFGSYAIPYHYAVRSDDVNGQRVTTTESGRRYTGWGAEALAGGVGIGYTGLNAQLDIRNALHLTTGAITFGLREKISFGPVEIWGRLGIGPALVFDSLSDKVKTTGAIAGDLSAGVDYFLIRDRLALGLNAQAAPQYNFPSNLYLDFGFSVGVRVLL
jgi:hypothetical protein